MATKDQQLQLGCEVSEYFTHRQGVEFVGFAGLGRHGGAIILDEKDDDGRLLRKLVIKYSLGALTSDRRSNADDDLRNEHRWLEALMGAEHIVRLVPFADCSLNLPGISNGEDTFEDSVAKLSIADEALKPSRIRKCPTFALEYLPNGTMLRFSERLYEREQLIPNRILWRIWLCMVRQCVAMAFPPQQSPENYRPERERINPNQEFCTLTQNSSHMANFVFGEDSFTSPDDDHNLGVPIVKLIDFGRGRLENPREFPELTHGWEGGVRSNIWGAASVMADLACPLAEDDELSSDEANVYFYTKDNSQRLVVTNAHQYLRESGEMDLALRDTLARCLATGLEDQPPIQEILAEAEERVANRGPNDDPYLEETMHVEESDEYIRRFLQTFIFDPPTR